MLLKKLFLLSITLTIFSSCGNGYQRSNKEPQSVRNFNKILSSKRRQTDDFASVIQIINTKETGEIIPVCSGTIVCNEGETSCSESDLVKTSGHCFINDAIYSEGLIFISQYLASVGALNAVPIKNSPNQKQKEQEYQLQIIEPFFSTYLSAAVLDFMNYFTQSFSLRMKVNGKISDLNFVTFEVKDEYVQYYLKYVRALFLQDQVTIDLLESEEEKAKHSALDQAVLKLDRIVKDIKIYPQATKEEVEKELGNGDKVIIVGWGLNADKFTLGFTGLGLNQELPEVNNRYQAEVSVRQAMQEDGYFSVGRFSRILDYIYGEEGACPGDSGGGSFLKINGSYKHVGTITSIQAGLCGSPVPVDEKGKVYYPSSSLHTNILFW